LGDGCNRAAGAEELGLNWTVEPCIEGWLMQIAGSDGVCMFSGMLLLLMGMQLSDQLQRLLHRAPCPTQCTRSFSHKFCASDITIIRQQLGSIAYADTGSESDLHGICTREVTGENRYLDASVAHGL
jgi:hypothetical protein